MNRRLGRVVMYMIFVMIGIMLYATIARTFFNLPPIWSTELAQMIMASYYLLGGAYSMLLGDHVRMDLLYGSWSPKRKAFADTITSVFLFFYICVLLYGGISSALYAIEYDQKNFSVWAPRMAPIKVVMAIGICLMLLQVVSTFFKELAAFRGRPITETLQHEVGL